MFLVPTSGVADWKKLLADPDKHWREGYSAHALATRWQTAHGFPPEISALLATQPVLAETQMLLGIPEHKVPLPGGARASQTDLWVLGRTRDELVSMAIEGKVRESFGPTLTEWMTDETSGRQRDGAPCAACWACRRIAIGRFGISWCIVRRVQFSRPSDSWQRMQFWWSTPLAHSRTGSRISGLRTAVRRVCVESW